MRVISAENVFASIFRGYISSPHIEAFEDELLGIRKFDLKWNQDSSFLNLSNILFDLNCGKKNYLMFHEQGIWPSSENRYLFEALCQKSIGSNQVGYADAVEFGMQDRMAGVSFLQLALQFGWGGLFISDRERWFYFSHDSWGMMITEDAIPDYLYDIVNMETASK